MVRWVRDGVMPPPSSSPSRADGTFVTVAEQSQQYPANPGKPYNSKISEIGMRNFDVFPPSESAERYPQFVPRLDRDGNPVAGVIIPEIAVPVATVSEKRFDETGSAKATCVASMAPRFRFRRQRPSGSRGGSAAVTAGTLPWWPGRVFDQYANAVEKLVTDRYLLSEDGARLRAAATLPQ